MNDKKKKKVAFYPLYDCNNAIDAVFYSKYISISFFLCMIQLNSNRRFFKFNSYI